jgi:hypothetical protein
VLTQTEPLGDQYEVEPPQEHHIQFLEPREEAPIAFQASKEAFDFIPALV